MHWLLWIMTWILVPPKEGVHQIITNKEKWVLNEAVHYSDTHLGHILQRRYNQGRDSRTYKFENIAEIQCFKENLHKLQLLEYLQNDSICLSKRQLAAALYLDDKEDNINHMLRGGLLDDWDYEF